MSRSWNIATDDAQMKSAVCNNRVHSPLIGVLFTLALVLSSCTGSPTEREPADLETVSDSTGISGTSVPMTLRINHDVLLNGYLDFMDSLIAQLDTTLNYPVNEYALVLNNPWLIDSLENTDYYRLKGKGIFVEDPGILPVLRQGDTIIIPDSNQVKKLYEKLKGTVLDVNIPEYTLRIIENGQTLYSFPVRVGKDEKKYLAMAGREVDLRTKPGVGEIISVHRKPTFINPADNRRYFSTKRDDGMITKLPTIPWLEPELDGQRFGQLIHPTTNPETLGKASSNGCIGMREADMWRLYYHAPVGTPIIIRYDLVTINEKGDSTRLKNIYPGFEKIQKRKEIIAAATEKIKTSGQTTPVCDCGNVEK